MINLFSALGIVGEIKMLEKLNVKGLRPFLLGLFSSTVIWMCYVCFFSYGQTNCLTKSTVIKEYESAGTQLKGETANVRTLIQVMYKVKILFYVLIVFRQLKQHQY